MFETIDTEDVSFPVAPVASDTKDDLEQFAPLKRDDYAGFKEEFLKWLLREGKSPTKGEGYEVGDCGSTESTVSTKSNSLQKYEGQMPPVRNPSTTAAKFQQIAEQNGIEMLSHEERWRVACRVLKRGWQPAWEWFKDQYGPSFDPNLTWEQFRSVVKLNPDDYSHVEVPPKPR